MREDSRSLHRNAALLCSATMLGAGLLSTVHAQEAQESQTSLYEGEERLELAGYPAVAHFTEGQPDAPLIVFAPGAHHMARIAYGGHEGARDEDFLAHWLGEKGMNFLALSYPIETGDSVFDEAHPGFTARDWGQQIAEAASAAIEEHGLTGDIYLIAWSMAGKVMQPAFQAMQEAGLELEAAISFAATPGIPGVITMTRELEKAPSGYANRSDIYAGWFDQISENAGDEEPAIPEDVFLREYVGNMSVNLQGYGEVHRNGEIEIDHMAQAEDYGAFAFENYPLVAIMLNELPADARHALNDESYWTLYNTNTLSTRQLQERGVSPADLPEDRWADLVALSREADERLSIDVGGNHFFFVGEEGARAAADAVVEAVERVNSWNEDVDQIVSGSPE